ncbi:MAG: FKBP-type peptidyl-prolyl cis-trans isomerase [Nocardioidaceae bacterium]
MRLLVAAVVLPLLLVTSACGSNPDEGTKAKVATVADVHVSGDLDSKPKIDFKAPITFKETHGQIIDKGPGTGDAIKSDSLVTIDYAGVNASDGTEFDNSYDGSAATFSLNQVIKGFGLGLAGAHAGDRVLIAVASKDAYDPTGNGSAIRKGDSVIFVADVHKVANPLAEATGKPMDAPATVPTLTYDKDKHPEKFTASTDTPKTVDKLGVYPIIKGNGPEVKTGQTITAEYVAQIYPDGKVFDESWSSDQPLQFPIGSGGVIQAWDEGLVGQTVGSRVVLVVPSDLGYGKQGSPPDIPADTDLIFVIDLLQAQ